MVSAIFHWFQLFYFLTSIIPVVYNIILYIPYSLLSNLFFVCEMSGKTIVCQACIKQTNTLGTNLPKFYSYVSVDLSWDIVTCGTISHRCLQNYRHVRWDKIKLMLTRIQTYFYQISSIVLVTDKSGGIKTACQRLPVVKFELFMY